jgi:hypothetical protein
MRQMTANKSVIDGNVSGYAEPLLLTLESACWFGLFTGFGAISLPDLPKTGGKLGIIAGTRGPGLPFGKSSLASLANAGSLRRNKNGQKTHAAFLQ